MQNDKENLIVKKTVAFSLAIIKYCEVLEHNRKYVVANQLLKSGTSIGANVFESQHAESRADFIHKMKVVAKEASETMYWLILCEKSESYRCEVKLRIDLQEILRILSKIISSAKR
jgi:four helix bundle protein